MLRDRVKSYDEENRLVVHERHQMSLNINSNAALVGLATAVGACAEVYLFLKKQ